VGSLDHLWLHFTEMGRYREGEELQVIVRGDGCYLEDATGRRYLDALAGLFCVNIGYGFGEEMGEAAAAQMRELPFAINWTFAHPRSIELAAEVAALAPGDLNRVFFVSRSCTAPGSARSLPASSTSAACARSPSGIGFRSAARTGTGSSRSRPELRCGATRWRRSWPVRSQWSRRAAISR
jgi:hypothetical protein